MKITVKNYVFLTVCICLLGCSPSTNKKNELSEQRAYEGPIIDMHLHALEDNELSPEPMAMCTPLSTIVQHFDPQNDFGDIFWGKAVNPDCTNPYWSPVTYKEYVDRLNHQVKTYKITAVTSGSLQATKKLMDHFPDQFMRGIQFRINRDSIAVDSLKSIVQNEGMDILGEISNQYGGIAPNDPIMYPYYAMAEEMDVPILLHMGSGLPGTPLFLNPEYQVGHSNPLLLEEILKKYPKMRISIAHYGEPFIDELIAMMYHYPQLYVDLGGIQWCYPREYFYQSHLKKLIDAGFGKRIMFGSDMIIWPELIEESIAIINNADFLTYEQKADIFYNNAARFLRLSKN
ncbi:MULTISPECIES: amidohydrolase family protein [unclassified Flagellimonas]|uniref:Amidohydrolase family protein n=1 Tax=Flagellimonas sp. MMG031 TaxID=3158549 RepID=A0AAU7MVX5_9FLAO